MIMGLSSTGSFTVRNFNSGSVGVYADVVGWYKALPVQAPVTPAVSFGQDPTGDGVGGGWWKLNNDLTDSTTQAHTLTGVNTSFTTMPAGTGTNGLPLVASGTPALSVTGTNSQATGTIASSSTSLTLSAVVVLQPGTANSYAAVHLRGASGTAAMLWVNKDTATGKWAMQAIVSTTTNDTKYLWSDWDSIKPGIAAKVAISADVVSHQARLWVNGVSQPFQTFTGNLVAADTITVGAERYNATSTGQGWIGKIADVRLFPRVLTATQQLDLYTPSSWTVVPVTPPPAIDLTAYGAGFQQIQPVRILDTRSALGIATTTTQNNVEVTVADGPGISSVAISITVLGTTTEGYATVFPPGETDPGTSTINYLANDLVSSATITRVSGDGKIRIKLNGINTAHILIDLFGFYGTGASVSVSANNKLVNGSFETGTSTTSATAWDINTVCGDAANQISLTRVNAPADNIGGAADGNNYVRIQKTSATAAGSLCQNVNHTPVTGQQYELTFMTRTAPGQTSGRGLIELWELGNNNPGTGTSVSSNTSTPFITSASWTPITVTMCARNANAFSLRAKIFPFITSAIDIDNVRLTIATKVDCVVNPGVPSAAVIPSAAPPSNLADGSMEVGSEWGSCLDPSYRFTPSPGAGGTVVASVVPTTLGSFGNALLTSRSQIGGGANRLCHDFQGQLPKSGDPWNTVTPHKFRAWVRSADSSNFPASLELNGWILTPSPACNPFCPKFLATTSTQFTATSVWQLIEVVWWPPTHGVSLVYAMTFQVAILTSAPNRGLLIDEADEFGQLTPDPSLLCRPYDTRPECGGGTSNPSTPSDPQPVFPMLSPGVEALIHDDSVNNCLTDVPSTPGLVTLNSPAIESKCGSWIPEITNAFDPSVGGSITGYSLMSLSGQCLEADLIGVRVAECISGSLNQVFRDIVVNSTIDHFLLRVGGSQGSCIRRTSSALMTTGCNADDSSQIWVDLEEGSYQWDKQGLQILRWYMTGAGQTRTINNADSLPLYWRGYMRKHFADPTHVESDSVVADILNILIASCSSAYTGGSTCTPFNFAPRNFAFQNGASIKGYNYMHGSNSTVGDFKVNSSVPVFWENIGSNQRRVLLDVSMTFNDIMDPNTIYEDDITKNNRAARICDYFDLKVNLPNGAPALPKVCQPNAYEFHVTWTQRIEIRFSTVGPALFAKATVFSA